VAAISEEVQPATLNIGGAHLLGALGQIGDDVFGLGHGSAQLGLTGLLAVNNRGAKLSGFVIDVVEELLTFWSLGHLVCSDKADTDTDD